MKNVLTLFVVVMSVVSLAAQSLPENIFKNLSSKGRVSIAKSEVLSSFEENKPFIMREYYDVGEVTIGVPIGKAKVYCQAVVVTSVKTGEKAGFCRISANPKLGLASITGKDRFATIFFTYPASFNRPSILKEQIPTSLNSSRQSEALKSLRQSA